MESIVPWLCMLCFMHALKCGFYGVQPLIYSEKLSRANSYYHDWKNVHSDCGYLTNRRTINSHRAFQPQSIAFVIVGMIGKIIIIFVPWLEDLTGCHYWKKNLLFTCHAFPVCYAHAAPGTSGSSSSSRQTAKFGYMYTRAFHRFGNKLWKI